MVTALDSFCSHVCQQGKEPLHGSAISAQHYLFISWPRHLWAPNQFDSDHFPSELREYLGRLQKDLRVATRLVHRTGIAKDKCFIIIMPEAVCYEAVGVSDLKGVIEGYFTNRPDEKFIRRKSLETFVFCCTHGTRDKCCAKFGRAALKEFRNVAKQIDVPLEVWESTHLGGDRFAANALVFPHGYMYGRIRVEDVGNIIKATVNGVPFAPCYRGSVTLVGAKQLVEAFGQNYCHERGLPSKVVLGKTAEIAPDHHIVELQILGKSGQVEHLSVVCKRQDFNMFASCKDLHRGFVKRATRWVVESFEHIPH
jgi:hypothetical protein